MNLSTFITLLKDETDANSIFAMVFERTRECSETNTRILLELYNLLQNFEKNDKSRQRMLLQITVLIVGDLSKDKNMKEKFDQFRDILFKIIQNVADNESNDWFLETTLPAFVILVKTIIQTYKTNPVTSELGDKKQMTHLIKLYLRNSVIIKRPLSNSSSII